MKKHLLPQRKNFYKANMHCHSDWSDAQLSIEELKQLYKSKGYSVLSITDHEGLFYHPELDDEDFLTIAGVEYEFNGEQGHDFSDWIVCHLCAYKKDPTDVYQIGLDPTYSRPYFRWSVDENLRSLVKSKGDLLDKSHTPEAINEAIRRFQEEGFIVTYNHPKWSGENHSVYSKYKGMNNLEIYNTSSVVAGYDDDNGEVFDDMLQNGQRVFCVAADDNHNKAEDSFGGFIMLSADNLTYKEIIDAFEKGEFYSSCGPIINEIYYEDGYFCISSETPLKEICFHTNHRHAARVLDKKGNLFEAKFEISPTDKYIRAELLDKNGKKAYTQAYFVEDFLK